MASLQQSDAPLAPEVLIDAPALDPAASSAASRFTRNAFISVGRLFISTLVALVLPAYLTHKLPVKTYSAWVLILQMSAYVGYLEFGIQSGISKYVAEFHARRDLAGAGQRASAGLALMAVMSTLGVLLTLVLAWRVPSLFHEMPPEIYRDVRFSLIFVGTSLSIALLSSICSAIFMGLQQYGTPTVLTLINRFLYTAAVMAAVYFHSSLASMGFMVAAVNLTTAGMQFVAWHRMKERIALSFRGIDRGVLRQLIGYCSSLAIWSAGMLCVSGLDVTIVGRYDFAQTAFYSIAVLPTNFMISMMGAALAPLMPTASALSVHRTPAEMGQVLVRSTRYASVVLILAGLPLLVCGEPILRLWVGPLYAAHTVAFLRILVLANIFRNLCLPYSSMLIATESQRVAILGASAEAVVNLSASIYLARHMGAIGVAYGTLLGSLVSVAMHFAVSMHYTYPKLAVSRTRMFFGGMARPALMALPSLALVRLWWVEAAPAMTPLVWALWAVSTLLIAWFGCLDSAERMRLGVILRSRIPALRVQ